MYISLGPHFAFTLLSLLCCPLVQWLSVQGGAYPPQRCQSAASRVRELVRGPSLVGAQAPSAEPAPELMLNLNPTMGPDQQLIGQRRTRKGL
jgi:hypothetical protein